MNLRNQILTADSGTAARALLLQGGRMTKWKGRVASVAPILCGAAAVLMISGPGAEAACTNTTVARATAGSLCTGTNLSYSAAGGAAGVVQSTGAGSSLTMTQATVAVTSTNLHGVNVEAGGTLTFAGSVTAISGQGGGASNARAVVAQSGNASLTVNGNLSATRRGGGTGGAAVEAAGNSTITVLGAATIVSNALSAQGIRVNSGGVLNITGPTSIQTTRSNSQGVIVAMTGTAGGGATPGSALARFGDLTVQTLDTGSHGIQAQGTLNNTVVVNGALQVTTAQSNAIGLYALNGGKILVDPTATTGTANESANVTLLGGTVSTAGLSSHGVKAEVSSGSAGSAGIVFGGGAVAPSVTTIGADAEGLFALVSAGTGNASVRMDAGSVTTSGSNADGIVVQIDDNNAATALNGNARADMNGGTISTSGTASAGIVAQTDLSGPTPSTGNATARQTGGTITTTGGTLGGFQSSFGIGALVSGSGTATVDQQAGSITTSGAEAHGLYALSAAGDVVVNQGVGGQVAVSGVDASGIRAVSASGGDVDVTLDGTVDGGSGAAAGLWMDTAAGMSSRAAINGSVGAASGVAIANNGGDSDVRVTASGLVRGEVRLSDGDDRLSFAGSDLSQTTILDGGDDLLVADGFVDVLTLGSLSSTLTGANLLGWEQVVIDNASVAFADDLLATGSDAGMGLSVVNGGILDARTAFALTGNLSVGAGARFDALGAGAGAYLVSGDVSNSGTFSFDDGTAGDVLTIAGNYTGAGGTLRFDASLGADGSPSDLLHVMGNASGSTALFIQNVGGAGAATTQGIRVVQVDGTSTATAFSLGNAAPLQAGAYVYTLAFGDPASAADQNWYLRAATSGGGGGGGTPIIGSIGALYEMAPSVLLTGFADLPTLEERIGHGIGWSAGSADQRGTISRGWARITDSRSSATPEVSASGARYDSRSSSIQAGLDLLAFETAGGFWTLGATVQAGHVSADISNAVGSAQLSGDSYGIGATATWYGDGGTYVDLQARYDRIEADFAEGTVGQLASGVAFDQTTLGVEVGHRFALDGNRTLVPQAQLTWAHLSGDAFTDSQSSLVGIGENERIVGRIGLAYEVEFDRADATQGGKSFEKLYVIGNVEHDFSAETSVDVAGAALGAQHAATWGEVGLGGSVIWDDNKTFYAEGLYRQALDGSGGNDGFAVSAGFRMEW